MQLIRNPNAWSCLLASMAMVLDRSTEKLIEAIGHDGSEIMFPDLLEPAKRRGFHIQEFISLILESGYAVTAIEVLPYSTPDGEHEFPINFPNFENRFWNLTYCVPGIFTGMRPQRRHAVAWDGYKIYDPLGSVYERKEIKNFDIDIFHRFDQYDRIVGIHY